MSLLPCCVPVRYGVCRLSRRIDLADFEGANYGTWTAMGNALGTGPAHGTLGILAQGGGAHVKSLAVRKLRSAWTE